MSGVEPPELRAANVYRSMLHTVLLYVISAALWILLSDQLLSVLTPASAASLRTALSIAKGWAFVIVTGLLLYALLCRLARSMLDADRRYRDGLAEAERQKRDFFQNTIAAITEGKLLVREPAVLDRLVPSPQYAIGVTQTSEAPVARARVRETMTAMGFDADQVQDFAVAVGEAITNALKHAGGGEISVHSSARCLWARVSDAGPGIADLMLPRALLERGYSTKPSLGMGYTLMLSLADRVYLSTGPGGTIVVLEICRRTPGSEG